MNEKVEILATLEEYAQAYCAKDVDRLMSIFDDGGDISLIGTGADELCAGADEVRSVFVRNFAEATATRFEWHWQHVTIVDNSAVVAITMTIHLNTESGTIKVPIRWTVSLVKKSGQWKWLHRHASSATASQDEGTAYPDGVE